MCDHLPDMLQNFRPCRWTRGPETVWVADCATARGGCGQIVPLDSEAATERSQGLGDVDHGGGRGSGAGSSVRMDPTLRSH